jgi:hypothetical protein
MAKHHVTRLDDVVINLQPYGRLGEQSDEQRLAPLDRLASQIPPIEFEQIERAQEYVCICPAAPQLLDHRHVIIVSSNRLAIDKARRSLEQERGARDQ